MSTRFFISKLQEHICRLNGTRARCIPVFLLIAVVFLWKVSGMGTVPVVYTAVSEIHENTGKAAGETAADIAAIIWPGAFRDVDPMPVTEGITVFAPRHAQKEWVLQHTLQPYALANSIRTATEDLSGAPADKWSGALYWAQRLHQQYCCPDESYASIPEITNIGRDGPSAGRL